ncbi:MAG: molybdopterin molybdotransferase MoeA [Puniceicoccaceae bacterium]
MITVAEAFQLVSESIPAPLPENVGLSDATGRILLEDIHAERDMPPFDRVMMDGYALKWSEFLPTEFEIKGIALAGHPSPELEDESGCIEVTTGAPLPTGCDVVVPVEDCIVEDNCIRLRDGVQLEAGKFIHTRGSDGLMGRRVLERGTYLGPPELSILASEAMNEVAVGLVPRICLVTTGDEVVLNGGPVLPHQIRGSHSETLKSVFSVFPGMQVSHAHALDDEGILTATLEKALEDSDILIITGGVSRGKKDLVPGILKNLHVEEVLHRVGQRPGKPLWFGKRGAKLVFGLPGNPVSALVCARRYIFPVVEKSMGRSNTAPRQVSVPEGVEALANLVRFTPVVVSGIHYKTAPFHTSGSLHDLAGTAGFIEVPAGGHQGDIYDFYPWTSR